ncbi:MAG: hypothetical protein A3G33_00045 [Omnitrophica bacterium RIFCSPLOWO2_12_FULL_44_17]|uniref:PilZ domain-containing protein n=1 Tax=Candidatus Danuiimicrobium aquiferis TaxID=1801832 RepID=A0A1G1KST7_9BACT|nr:MAG: hypothetical protein A3B72_10155 [Omnitrophica bacterium RIFCSPHIGHO2_02_FULL_45_28]OGW88276.1 MAG: hypothetical protein A3E74_10470 [Omnitrophica bacterium RIFCSPHIGHO2_12_FULL_44_12]OGW95971.1 MAG: hypothetical protein A3G33_00045 [Omnitrophica bacterium RIFCSPLOWO2_12_FULL_44_17]OGX01965.1 MAG: hypothetical protein A3J12_04625 [Omnitrophica bacterium RIFCSPLOWO2_02_FULL_44_11]
MPAGRKFQRVKVSLLAGFKEDEETKVHKTRLLDLSAGGARLIAAEIIPVGTRLTVQIKNPEKGEVIETMGYVVRYKKMDQENGYEVALRFMGMKKEVATAIGEIVHVVEREERIQKILREGKK